MRSAVKWLKTLLGLTPDWVATLASGDYVRCPNGEVKRVLAKTFGTTFTLTDADLNRMIHVDISYICKCEPVSVDEAKAIVQDILDRRKALRELEARFERKVNFVGELDRSFKDGERW